MAINNCVYMGRLTRDPELRHTTTNKAVASFTLAVDRDGKDAGTDFIPCIAWEKKGEFISRFFRKGNMMAVEGEMRSRTYEDKQTGKKHAVLECRVSKVSFTGERKTEEPTAPQAGYGDEYQDLGDEDGGEVPF